MNLGIFTGRLGDAPRSGKTNNGEPVLNFSLATDVGTKAVPSVLWLDCALYGKRAEILAQYLEKGTKVTVSGRLNLVEFKKKDGTQDKKLTVNVSELDMHGSPTGNTSQSAHSEAKTNGYQAQTIDQMMDDIPF